MQIVRIGLDSAKYVFEAHGVDARGKVVLRKTLRRDAVSRFFANVPRCLVGMEASNGAHYWARVLTNLGHDVRLINPQFVKPYVKSNKNDRNDAEAICEAIGRPSMRFVPPKSSEQLAIQAVHRIRRRLVTGRARLANQIRGLLAEQGIVIARDISRLRRALADIAGNDDDSLNEMIRTLVQEVREELANLDQRIASYDRRVRELYRASELCQRIGKIEGIGRSRWRSNMLQEWPSVCRLAGARTQATIERRTNSIARYQQARRSLFAYSPDPWRSCCAGQSRRQTRPKEPLARQDAGAASSQCRCCRAGQQECQNRLGHVYQ